MHLKTLGEPLERQLIAAEGTLTEIIRTHIRGYYRTQCLQQMEADNQLNICVKKAIPGAQLAIRWPVSLTESVSALAKQSNQ